MDVLVDERQSRENHGETLKPMAWEAHQGPTADGGTLHHDVEEHHHNGPALQGRVQGFEVCFCLFRITLLEP
jgi:hypothetical protein